MIRKHLSLLKEHPQGLWWLTLTEFWDRFSFYGIQALLVLYLTKRLGLGDGQAYIIYGGFTALTFAGTIFGGVVADKFIGFYKALVTGIVLMVLGNLFLLTLSAHTLYLGLAFITAGISLFKPNNASLIGALYHDNDARRDSGFSLFYMGMNAGAILGPLSYGFLSLHLGWSAGFTLTTIGMSGALICVLLKRRHLKELHTNHKVSLHKRAWVGIQLEIYLLLALAGIVAVCVLLLQNGKVFSNILDMVGITTLFVLAWIAWKSNEIDRKHIIGLVALSLLAITFFACSLQTATTLMLFIDRDIDRQVFGVTIPTMAFLSLEPFFIILLAPIVAKIWDFLKQKRHDISPPRKMSYGIFFAAISFVFFAIASLCHQAQDCRALVWVVIGNIPLGLGELLIFPVALSAIANFAPLRLRGTMMGVFFLALAFGGFFAGIIANLISSENHIAIAHSYTIDYTHAFLNIAMVTAGIGVFVWGLSFWLKRFLTDA